VFKAEKRV
jgi:hypothetical protein